MGGYQLEAALTNGFTVRSIVRNPLTIPSSPASSLRETRGKNTVWSGQFLTTGSIFLGQIAADAGNHPLGRQTALAIGVAEVFEVREADVKGLAIGHRAGLEVRGALLAPTKVE